METFTDSDDDYDEVDGDINHQKSVLPKPHKCHSPISHIPVTTVAENSQNLTHGPNGTANNAKRSHTPSKSKSESANQISSCKSKRLHKNGVNSTVPDASIRYLDVL